MVNYRESIISDLNEFFLEGIQVAGVKRGACKKRMS